MMFYIHVKIEENIINSLICCFLLSKDALNWSKMTVNTFILLDKNLFKINGFIWNIN